MAETISGMFRSDTEKAVLLRMPVDNGTMGFTRDVWVPRSIIDYVKKENRGPQGKWWICDLPDWFIAQERLIVDEVLPKDYFDRDKAPKLDLPEGLETHREEISVIEAVLNEKDPMNAEYFRQWKQMGTCGSVGDNHRWIPMLVEMERRLKEQNGPEKTEET